MCFWNRIEESKQDGSREEYMSVSKFHSRHQFFSWLFELLPSYPASSPEFPVDSDFPGMVYVLYMLQYPSFSTNLPISSLYRPANAEGSQSFEYVALLKPMRRFHICIQCRDHNIFFIAMAYLFLDGGKEPTLTETQWLLVLGKNTRMKILKIFVDFRLKCAKTNGYKPKSERVVCFIISGPAYPLIVGS